jgi:hypothetical protein
MAILGSALEALLADHSPRSFALQLPRHERSMLLMAQRIRGLLIVPPDPAFIARLHSALFGADLETLPDTSSSLHAAPPPLIDLS